jgi:hypothetical protein
METGAVVAEFVELTEVVTSAYSRCHSWAPRSGEPGIHTPRPWLWIPGSSLRTQVGYSRLGHI